MINKIVWLIIKLGSIDTWWTFDLSLTTTAILFQLQISDESVTNRAQSQQVNLEGEPQTPYSFFRKQPQLFPWSGK